MRAILAAATAALILAPTGAATPPSAQSADEQATEGGAVKLAVTTVTPASGSTVSGSIRWEAAVTVGTASRVEFFVDVVDATPEYTDYAAPYVFNGDQGVLDTTRLSNGSHTLTVRAYNKQWVASSSVTVTVNNVGVAISQPAHGSTVSACVAWEAVVTAGSVSQIDFFVDGVYKWREQYAPYRFNGDTGCLDTSQFTNGGHELKVVASGPGGATATATAFVTFNNIGVAISQPANGSVVRGCVVWEAVVTAGSVSQIDFYVDGVYKWTERNAPYRFNGDTSCLDTTQYGDGAHELKVVASGPGNASATASIGVTFASSVRYVYCLGDPSYDGDGWKYDGTSTGWIRQFPYLLPERVSFDSSVTVMQSLGCSTVRAELRPTDPDPNGGTDVQRAQAYTADSLLAQYGNQPPLDTTRGSYRWYSFAFTTNPGYKPQRSSSWPNWNGIFSWHDTGGGAQGWAPQANLGLSVGTAGPAGGGQAKCGDPYVTYDTPKLDIELNGGDETVFRSTWSDTATTTCLRFFGPDFVPGKRYVVQMGIKWGRRRDGLARGLDRRRALRERHERVDALDRPRRLPRGAELPSAQRAHRQPGHVDELGLLRRARQGREPRRRRDSVASAAANAR